MLVSDDDDPADDDYVEGPGEDDQDDQPGSDADDEGDGPGPLYPGEHLMAHMAHLERELAELMGKAKPAAAKAKVKGSQTKVSLIKSLRHGTYLLQDLPEKEG